MTHTIPQLSLSAIQDAQARFKGVIRPSPLIRVSSLSRALKSEIWLKLENLQETGSFKIRGAYNRMLCLGAEERPQGVVAASAGNHAQGVAWASSMMGIRATIVMPEDVSIRKLLAVKEYGAEVILHGTRYDEAFLKARSVAEETGMTLIPAFDDPHVIAGQGTIGLEIADHLENGVTVVVPVGGGGLISGIAVAVKETCPDVRVVGVQSNSCPSTIRSLAEARPTVVPVAPTLSDGIAVNKPGDLTFPIIQHYADEVVGVEEEATAGAILSLLERANVIAEGAGATPLAALMDDQLGTRADRHILVISGGNIEINTIDRILQRGSIKLGRLIRVEVNVSDTPGSLWRLLGFIAREKANILHIEHDRLDLQNPIEVSRVILDLETRGHDHARGVVDKLRNAGYQVRRLL